MGHTVDVGQDHCLTILKLQYVLTESENPRLLFRQLSCAHLDYLLDLEVQTSEIERNPDAVHSSLPGFAPVSTLGEKASDQRLEGLSSTSLANNNLDSTITTRSSKLPVPLTPDHAGRSSSAFILWRLRDWVIRANRAASRVSPVRKRVEDRNMERVHCQKVDSEGMGDLGCFGPSAPCLEGRLKWPHYPHRLMVRAGRIGCGRICCTWECELRGRLPVPTKDRHRAGYRRRPFQSGARQVPVSSRAAACPYLKRPGHGVVVWLST